MTGGARGGGSARLAGAMVVALAVVQVLAGSACTDSGGRPSAEAADRAGAVGAASGRSAAPGGDTTTPAMVGGDSALSATASALLPAVEAASGLPRLRPVLLAIRSREDLAGYLEDQLDEALPVERAERIEAAYRRLGLLPDTLELRRFLRELYMEQVAGYYDPASDTLFVMEGSSGDELRTVLVHEMVHALQDQRVDLDSITEALDRENDRSTAFQAAVEGQATYVMTEWRLGRMTGREVDLTTMPELMDQIRNSVGAGGGMPVFESAPRIIRETLTFPYLDGMGFVQQVWRERPGRPPPFDSLQPLSTEQVIHPAKLAGPDADAPTLLAPARFPEGWEERYADTLGELEFRIFLTEHLADGERARRLAAGWDGDLTVLARADDGREVLTWTAVWDDAAAADSAAAGLGEAMDARYGAAASRAVTVERLTVGGRPAVVMVDLPPDVPREAWVEFAAGATPGEATR